MMRRRQRTGVQRSLRAREARAGRPCLRAGKRRAAGKAVPTSRATARSAVSPAAALRGRHGHEGPLLTTRLLPRTSRAGAWWIGPAITDERSREVPIGVNVNSARSSAQSLGSNSSRRPYSAACGSRSPGAPLADFSHSPSIAKHREALASAASAASAAWRRRVVPRSACSGGDGSEPRAHRPSVIDNRGLVGCRRVSCVACCSPPSVRRSHQPQGKLLTRCVRG